MERSLENQGGAAYEQQDADDRLKRLLTQGGVNVTADVQSCHHDRQAYRYEPDILVQSVGGIVFCRGLTYFRRSRS